MLEKKNKRLVILLVVLVSATLVTYWYGKRVDNFVVNKDLFKGYELGSIDQIALESAKGNVVLKFTGSRWKVNDQFPADRAMIDVLFATLQQVEPRRPVASSMKDSMATVLQRNSIKVSLFSSGEIQKTFFAGGNEAKNQAYFLDVDEGESYLMTIPGYRVYVSGIFELAENGWRDKFVFGFNWRNFQRLDFRVPKNPADDFVVAMEDNYFSVQGLSQVDTTKLNDFLDNVSLLAVSEYIPPSGRLDSLASVEPYATILVRDVARNEYLLELYPPSGENRQYMGRINGSQWATFQETVVAVLVRSRSFFGK